METETVNCNESRKREIETSDETSPSPVKKLKTADETPIVTNGTTNSENDNITNGESNENNTENNDHSDNKENTSESKENTSETKENTSESKETTSENKEDISDMEVLKELSEEEKENLKPKILKQVEVITLKY